MLLTFGANNFFSFNEGFDISLELGVKCPNTISKGRQVSNLLCVKGANASGKTNVLKTLSFLQFFCCNSFAMKPENEIQIASFFMNEKPTSVFCNFKVNNIAYHYEVELTPKEIIFEKLSRKSIRLSPVFERRGNKLIYCSKEFGELKNVKQRSNASLISTANQYEVKAMSSIYNFFASIITNVSSFGKFDFSSDYRNTSKYYKENPEIFAEAVSIIKTFDLGITNVEINAATNEDGSEYYFPTFNHETKVQRKWLVFHNESLGTQTLYRTLPYFIYALNAGGILVMDEFDTDYHPHMLQLLISYFDSEANNKKNAQLVFSTHNTEILDYMGKYRTVLVNKDSSESYAYRLDEIPGDIIRNDRPISPVYNSGRIGGVPRI
ncbi:MAG: ATP-binding protein [Methylococcales bacterium]|nr:ATP-binding protein [Methylococcales bacterium]MDD5105615.1 ATP-binding protein [Desulfuromonadaceae bacterium]